MSCWMYPNFSPEQKIRVVLPVCVKDAGLMAHNLVWQQELDGRKDFDCTLSIDASTPAPVRDEIEKLAWRTYADVEVLVYQPAPVSRWPNGPNWAFQKSAQHMARDKRPWFWMEPDCIPLKPHWLTVWNQAYHFHRKPIMGYVIPVMGHCNGTAVYPANFPMLSRQAMHCTDVAWDGLMKEETIHLTHNENQLLCHVWGIINGKAVPFGGEAAIFETQEQVQAWVNPRAVLFHRAKNSSLIERLREKRNEKQNPICAARVLSYVG